MPNFAVRRDCFRPPQSGHFQLCSAYPLERRELTHGLLHVRSVPFVLGDGDLTFRSNGGDVSVPAMPRATLDLAAVGEGSLGVALTRLRDNYRVATVPVRSRRFWMAEQLSAEQLRELNAVGEKYVLDIIDYRCCDFGWMALDSFVVPRAWVQVLSVEPFAGPRSGGTLIEITGKNFGSSVDGLTVFVGEQECTELRMTQRGSLVCLTPPGEGVGVTVSVVVGDYDRNLKHGPFGGHQSGHCGAESQEYPFTDCAPGEVDPRWGVPLRGFTYADPPVFVSSPPLEIAEDSLYMYTPVARDADAAFEQAGVTISAIELPVWLVYDDFAQVLSGIPLRSDVEVPESAMEAARPGRHRVVLEATDHIYVVRQTFFVEVAPLPSLLSETEGQMLFPTRQEHEAAQLRAKALDYHQHVPAPGSVGMLPEDAAGIALVDGRSKAESALRTLLTGLLAEPWLKEAEIERVLDAAEVAGMGLAVRDLGVRARSAIAAQHARVLAVRVGGPVARGKSLGGWFAQLEDALSSGAMKGSRVLEHTGTRLRVLIETLCSTKPSNYTVSCDFDAYNSEHVLDVRFGRGGISIESVVLEPADVPYEDLARRAVASDDIVDLMRAASDRCSQYARRYEEYAGLPEEYAPEWTPGTSLLVVHLPRLHSQVELALAEAGLPNGFGYTEVDDEQLVAVTLDIDHSFPYPTPPHSYATRMRVVRADGLAHHLEDGLAAMSEELTERGYGPLEHRLRELGVLVSERASRCLNDCAGHGWCNTAVFPPACECYEGYTFDDCSHVLCPANCTGNGACDDQRQCESNPETGERRCVGGTGKCACYAPFFGGDCSLRACPRNRMVVPDANFSAGEAYYEEMYGKTYGRLVEVKLLPLIPKPFLGGGTLRSENFGGGLLEAPYYGDPAQLAYLDTGDGVPNSGNSELLARLGEVPNADLIGGRDPSLPVDQAVLYLQFYDAADAERARADLYEELGSLPSRGVPSRARLFAQEAAALERQENALLARFGRVPMTCNGRGACDYHAGECMCAWPHFGVACEFTHCPEQCSGHGKCRYETGECECDDFYDAHPTRGCARRVLGLASTLCEDEALDSQVSLFLSCYMGAPLGVPLACGDGSLSQASAGPSSTYDGVKGAGNGGDCTSTHLQVLSGRPCPDCSGSPDPLYREIDVSHPIAPKPPGADPEGNLLFPESARRPRGRGVGAPPGTAIAFRLDAIRALGLEFSGFAAKAGIVQDDASCGECNATVPQCGARFEVYVDGVLAWDALVSTSEEVVVEIPLEASNLTLVTREARPTRWRPLTRVTEENPFGVYDPGQSSRAHYWLEEAPRTAIPPKEQSWCSLSAWKDARLLTRRPAGGNAPDLL